MDLKFLDSYFKVNKDKLPVTGQSIPAEFALFLRDRGLWNGVSSPEFSRLRENWFDFDRFSDKKEETMKNLFGLSWVDLPEKFKDMNKNSKIVRCSLDSSMWRDERYINYLREQWVKLRSILIDDKVENNLDLTFKDKIYGTVNERPFIYAFAETANCLLCNRENNSANKSFNKFNRDNDKGFSLIEAFTSSVAHQCQNHNEEYKESTLAFAIDLIKRVDAIYDNPTLKNVA